jgi:hypothetical protein
MVVERIVEILLSTKVQNLHVVLNFQKSIYLGSHEKKTGCRPWMVHPI